MRIKKSLTIVSCGLMLGMGFSQVLPSLNESVIAKAAVNKKISAKQFYNDINAGMIAVEKSNSVAYGISDINYMKTSGLNAYRGYTSFSEFLQDYEIYNGGSHSYDAVKYLYHHFYSRFDSSTQKVLKNDYNNSNVQDFESLSKDLAAAIVDWSNKYAGIAPAKSHVHASKQSLNHARSVYMNAKKKYSAHHSQSNKSKLDKAKYNLSVANAKYKALVH
ncbi:hypothetical protein [Apilactobacillus xinyiensis]|uniref:Surface layer protein A domain-containing protein n=1 Tax=Apilactobacillus xinyiensis TaxID=2841032 RepID=A0ABT0I246_9LACO|nr:hypothetical protein [Apilactobacillus xinyiensis]MCK8624794.1 hypothetical protein [Apilactobacillus xinyiensis]